MYETREQTTERTEVQLRYSLVSAVPDKTTHNSQSLPGLHVHAKWIGTLTS